MAFMGKTSYVKRVYKHRYIKPVSLLLAAVMLLGLTGCSKNEERISEPDNSSGNSQNISMNNSIEDFEPVPVPEGGWTVDSLAKTIRINGETLPEPFTVDNLGEKYSVELSSNGSGGYLRYKNKDIAMFVYKKDENGEPYNGEIAILQLHNSESASIITINGVGIGSSSDEVKKYLGDYVIPDGESELSGYYFANNEWDDNWWDNGWILYILFDEENKVEIMRFDFV